MTELVVELYGTRIGVLSANQREFDFEVVPEGIQQYGLDSFILSVAIPLAPVTTRKFKRRRQNFFRELLPEGRMLDWLAREAAVPQADTIGLLRRFGRDVAGALQIWDPDLPGEPKSPRFEAIEETQVAELLSNISSYPLGNKPGSGKSSLAGVQDKIVLSLDETGWQAPLDGYPSTHILKPVPTDLPTVIYDEEYGARLARAAGVASFETRIVEFAGVPALVIERYDRSQAAPQGRIHQEDFNQALGAGGHEKYQRYGGKVSLRRIARVLDHVTGEGDLELLLRMVVLSVAIGNLDMHAKNLSLLHFPDGRIELAPAYDVVPQVHQVNDGELAMSVAGIWRHTDITRDHLILEGKSWGLKDPQPIITEVLETVLEQVSSELPHPNAYKFLQADIDLFSSNLLKDRPAGTATG